MLTEDDLDKTITSEAVKVFDKDPDSLAVTICADKTLRYFSGTQWPVYFYEPDFISFEDFVKLVKVAEGCKEIIDNFEGGVVELAATLTTDKGLVGFKVPDIRALKLL